jgi:DNA polymerase-3 subunit beta
MKFSIIQHDLLEGLQRVSSVVPAKSTTPVLENILLDLEEQNLKITGTDLEVFVTTKVSPQEIIEPGSIALPAKVITEMMRSLPDIPVHFESDDNNKIKITTEQGFYQISGISKDNFPDIPIPSNDRTIEINNNKLKRMFSKTIFAVSSDELRPALMGVFIQIMSDEFRMVATDGHRLSKIVDKSFRCDDPTIRMIVPPKTIQIALKNLDNEGTTKIVVDEKGMSFIFNHTFLFTRLVEGQYPDYERVIPRDNDKTLIVNKDLLMASVKRVSLFSSVLTHQIRFSISQGKMTVLSEDVDIGGEAREELKVEYNSEPMEICYNAQYLLDVLRQVDTEDVTFSLKSSISASLFIPTHHEADESFIMLLMPIKISS